MTSAPQADGDTPVVIVGKGALTAGGLASAVLWQGQPWLLSCTMGPRLGAQACCPLSFLGSSLLGAARSSLAQGRCPAHARVPLPGCWPRSPGNSLDLGLASSGSWQLPLSPGPGGALGSPGLPGSAEGQVNPGLRAGGVLSLIPPRLLPKRAASSAIALQALPICGTSKKRLPWGQRVWAAESPGRGWVEP